MTRTLKHTTLAALLVVTGSVGAAANDGYLTSSSGKVVRDNYDECWHTGSWAPDDTIVGCDGKTEAPVAQVVTPAPAPIPDYRVEQVERVSLDAETFFAFDKATLKHGAIDKLDALIDKIKASEGVERITVTGHTDRIGPAAYNQALSERRATAVRDYLVERIGNGDRITTQGMGESSPVATCPDMKGAALIACLGPNRRVDVDAALRMTVVTSPSGQ